VQSGFPSSSTKEEDTTDLWHCMQTKHSLCQIFPKAFAALPTIGFPQPPHPELVLSSVFFGGDVDALAGEGEAPTVFPQLEQNLAAPESVVPH